MYFAKCWRDARLSVLIFALPLLWESYELLRHAHVAMGTDSQASPEWMVTRGLSVAGILLLFVAWSLGGDGIGHDIAEDRGAYMLTLPRRRRFFLWSDAGFSFALMTALAAVLMLLFEAFRVAHIIRLPAEVSLSALALIPIALSGIVFAGLIYSATYLCTMVVPRHGTARVVSIAVLIGYTYLYFKSRHAWGGITPYLFPSAWVDPFPDKLSSALAPGLWLQLGARVLVILLLLVAAQVVLERREIRA